MAKRVILIEDDLDLQRIYSSKIESAGFEVLLALEATQGWNLVKGEKPNIILLDIMLPGKMNGFDFLKKLKEDTNLKNIPVVVITNLETEKDEALKIGATDYVIKANTDLNQIVEKIKKYT
ncbi:hypothetical protein A2865_00235 [Candidatus Woesebacteria bacterium RIFCSPHIGHO2_01_FULL_39_17]|uniref:Response regulator receiver protein n=3 Tax=Candidatus Woeseibacteriota TaxID=1752722 RepID=A0A0G0QVA9_9BACT|nr:MAG: Response regulator receiver protein [Microgenomates group bacterium GW2011_GWC1_38_12]KKQ94206.1 MAG: Response regulator receiver protein [Candidatus Woesebacteria bacterium GW2011_GWB1_39_10b]KKR14270.1 MAG: Response regulator receiver protein [Candidatus Woesebacteria bacterium GW2011_GWA1_39_21b]OGM23660.1 MAG: hypothetical protein A2865_00235 [Candidatus Woesebacteria bacterium RIFCSPHIGHO2_01_FULL_39_17]OGM65482.1 MAG: hypothetical protein A3A52_00975 [Candidatus Woesebacteria bact